MIIALMITLVIFIGMIRTSGVFPAQPSQYDGYTDQMTQWIKDEVKK